MKFAKALALATVPLLVTPSGASTQLPQQADLVAWFNAADAGSTDNIKAGTWTDRVNGIVASQGTTTAQPTVKTNQAGGKTCLRSAGNAYMPIATPGPIRTAINSGDYTVLIVAAAQGKTTSGSVFNNTRISGADSCMWIMDGSFAGQYSAWGAPFSTLNKPICFGTTSKTGPINLKHTYIDGGCIGADPGLGPTSETYQFSFFGWADGQFKFNGDIYHVLIWRRGLTVAEVMQVEMWACEQLGRKYPWANMASILCCAGDSLTAGIDTSNRMTASYPALLAYDMALPYGAWHNLGLSGRTMTDIDSVAAYQIDGISALTGKDVNLCVTEWYNQRGLGATTAYNNAIAYLTNRKAASVKTKLILGTSTDSQADSANETNRNAFNNAFDTYMAGAHPLIDAYAPLHLNPYIGDNSAYATYSATKFAGIVHLTDSGQGDQKGVFKTAIDAVMSAVPTPATPTLVRNTAASNPRATYTVTPTGHKADDVLRFKRILSSVTTYVDYVIKATDVGGPFIVQPWDYLEDGAYTVSVQHFQGGKPSASSAVDNVTIAAPQVVLTPNDMVAKQSAPNITNSVTFTGVALTIGKRNLIIGHFYNGGPTKDNTTCVVDTINAKQIGWVGIGGHIAPLFLTDAPATHNSGSVTISFPGESVFIVDIASYAVDNFIGLVSEARSTGFSASDRTDTFNSPPDVAVIVMYSTTGSAPSWTWPGSTAGPNDGLIYIRHKNTGNASETYNVGNGTGGQSCSYTLRSS